MAKQRNTYETVQLREIVLIAGPALLLTLFAFWFAFQFVEPAPPKTITISTGNKEGAYYAFGKKYATRLAEAGIKVEVLDSSGSLQNLARLKDPKSPVDVALLQGGIASKDSAEGLVSLGRVFPEPLWVFYTGDVAIDRLAALDAKRIAIGGEGSGTRQLALALLARNAITAQTATLLDLDGMAAADALLAGKVDAMFLTTSPEAPLIQMLLSDPRSKLMNFSQALAYTRLFPYLVHVTLPAGVIDLVNNVPAQDKTLVAPKAALISREGLHPAVVDLLVDAAKDVHSEGGMFHGIGEFPEPIDPEFVMSPDATRYYERGESWLQRFLPFWLAIFLDRMFIMIVPIATILIPLIKIVPFVYEWRLKSRIMYWYAQLKGIEKQLQSDMTREKLTAFLTDIDEIDEAVSAIPMPLHYSDRFYELRAAVDLVRQRIKSRRDNGAGKLEK